MSAIPPSPTQDNPFAAWTATWDGVLQLQQRWWAQWAEGLQLWTSWWLTPMPPLTPADWQQATEEAVQTAGEAAQAVGEETGDVVPVPPVPLPTPPRQRGNQPRPH